MSGLGWLVYFGSGETPRLLEGGEASGLSSIGASDGDADGATSDETGEIIMSGGAEDFDGALSSESTARAPAEAALASDETRLPGAEWTHSTTEPDPNLPQVIVGDQGQDLPEVTVSPAMEARGIAAEE
jgi:hypothetical protein